MRFMRDGVPPPGDFGGQITKILVDKRYARNPQTGAIKGWGTKWLPK